MIYIKKILKRIPALTAALLLTATFFSVGTQVRAGAVEPPECNTAETVRSLSLTFPNGTIKAGVSPEFVMDGINDCFAQFRGRVISISTPVAFDQTTMTYKPVDLQGYPYTETSRDITIKPAVFSFKNKLSAHTVSEITQFVTEVRLYNASSFDSTGALKPDALMLKSASTHWTQTPFRTQ